MDDTERMPDHDPTAADAEWKKIQQRTFTRWCNEHLKVANIVIYDLETDLCDGIKLIVLLEVLAHKRVGKYNKKPNFKSQKLENVAIALKFIDNENIKLVNIDAGDIVKGNLKLILGLVWTLILKYQISMPMGDYEFDDDGGKGQKKKDSGMTPKQALLAWVKSKMPPEIPMNNFTTDWNDGRAVAALVDAVEPGLFPDVDPEDLDPNDAVNNAKKAMDTAEKYLGIPPVLDAADMCNPKVDEMSIMTYVSYFPEAKCKPGAPHRPQLPAAAKCSAEGPGITPEGLVAKQPAPFTVFTAGAGKGSPQVTVVGPERSSVPCEVIDNGDKTFSCTYSPPQQGIFDIHIKWKGRHIPKSPFRVKVASDLDSSKCYAEGPGLQSGIIEEQWTNFTVYTKSGGEGKLHVDIIDPHLSKVEMKIEEKGEGEYFVLYKPILHGKHTINIKFGGEPISKSPFHVNVVSSKKEAIPTKVKAYGPGLEPKGIVATTEAVFTVDGKDAGDGDLKVQIKGPKGEIPCDIKDNGDGTYTCIYKAQVAGRHTITITWSGRAIPKSPYRVEISPYVDITQIRAYGPGLEKGVAGQPCKFTVETNGAAVDTLGFAVEGPHQAEIKCRDLGNGKCEVIYYPTKPGDYTVHVTCNGQDIPDSPFTVPITPGGDASKCYAEGPGLEPEGLVANVPAKFTVFTKGAGVGEVEVAVKDGKTGRTIPVEILDNKDGTTSIEYIPDKPGKYTITVMFNGKPIPKSPFKVNISLNNPGKVKAYGPGLEKSTVGEPAKFTIETKEAGDGGLGLTIEGPTGTKIDCKDNGDGSCDVTYYPEEPGDHLINILFADKHILGSPFTAKASYPVDASKVVISGPGVEPGVKAGLPADIDIDATKAGDAPLEVEVLNPQNRKVKVEVDEEEPGLFAATYYPDKPGKYTVNVKYGGKHVPKSPVKIDVKPKADASKCKLKGPGLESPVVNEPTSFDVDCKRAGEGDLAPTITSPSGEKVEPTVKDNGDGTYTVGYTPTEDGPHNVDVKYDGDSIPGTPKEVNVLPKTDTGKVKAYGPGLEGALTGQKAQFTVDTREAGPGGLSLAIEGPSEAKLVCKDNKDGTCLATYVPEEPGDYDVHVKYADEHVPGSPFKVKATRPVDASKVKCFGPGVDKAPLFESAPTHFTVDTAEAGDAPLDVVIETPDRKKIKPDEIKKVDDNTYEVQYTPPKEGRYAVDVKYGDKPVANSPFRVRAGPPYDASKVNVSGPAVQKTGIVAEEVTKAVVDTTEAGIADLSALLETPSGKKIEPTITPLPDEPGKYELSYVPEETGNHKLNVKYGKDHVKDSPFRTKVAPAGDASKVKVSGEGIEKPRVGQLVDIIFDTTEAGNGKPRCSIKSPSGKDVPVNMIDNGDGTYTCQWTPTEEGVHNVDVTYGGEPVQGSPFKVKAVKAPEIEKIKANVLEEVESLNPCVDQPLEFGVDPRDAEPEGGKGKLTSSIVTPSGKTEYPDVRANADDTYAVTYTPKEPGIYSLSIWYEDEAIPGSPFQFEVVEGGPERVIAFGKGLERGIVEEPCEFTVITKDAGPGGLSLAVEGPSKAEIQCVDNGDGSCSVSYVPKEPGEYNVVVKFADKHIPGSPFAAEIYPKGSDLGDFKRERPVVGKPCDVKLDIPDLDLEKDFDKLTGTLRRPGSDKEEPVDLSKNPDGTVGVTFTPYEPGEHLISIKKRGKHVQNSPFSVMVQAPRLGDLFSSGHPADVDLSNIKGLNPEDFDKLTATLRRPKSKVEESVRLIKYPDDAIGVSFVPREPGEHFLTVKKDGHSIPGSPFSILVESEEPVNAVSAPVDAVLDLPGVNLPDDFKKLKGTLKRPSSNQEEPLQLVLNSDNSLSVSFIPKETGKHLVGVKKFNRHVNGSPIPIMVTSPEPVNRAGVPCGVGLEDIPVEDLPKLEAGLQRPGSNVEEPVRIKQNSDNTLSASFVPHEEGRHKLHVRKDKKPLPDSPYFVDVLGKDKLEEVHPVGRTCDVGLDIPGLVLPDDFDKLEATIKRPNSDKEEPLNLELYPDNTLGISFVPLEPGEHLIRVKKSGDDVPGSPFSIMVEPAEAPNAVGKPCDCQLDIPELNLPEDLPKLKSTLRRPGSDVEEPIKLKVLSDNTLSASFVPKAPGEHLITVKKNNRHVTGSPFPVMVTADEPANRVGHPVGVGLEDIPVEDLPRLEAGLQRPGSEVEEPVRIKQNSDDTLSAQFIPHEEGVHKLHVRKDKKPLPESPYLINVIGKDVVEEVHPVGRTCDVGLDIPGVALPDDFKKLSATLQRPRSKKEEPVNLELNPDNTLGVTFVPKEPGTHWIRVRKSGKEVAESPFPVKIEPAKPEYAVGDLCDVPLDVENLKPEDLPKLTATLKRPGSKVEEPVEPKITSDRNLSVSFIPKSPGEHLITVKKRNRPVPGSPFSLMVTAPEPSNEIGKPSNVPLENIPGKDQPKLDAGLLRPGSTVEEPVPIKKSSDGNLYSPFIPHEEGPHKINVRKAGKPVPDSPYSVDVPPKQEEKPAEEVYPVGRPCDVGLDVPTVKLPDDFKKLTGTLQRPNSKTEEPVNLELNPDSTLGVSFVPKEPGEHLILVKKSGKEVPESPFSVMVEPVQPECAVGAPCDVPIDVGDIKPEDLPKLTATLKRPGSNVEEPVEPKILSDGSLSVSFIPKSPGEHLITVKKRNRPIPGSPFSVMVTAPEPKNEIGKPSNIPLENIPAKDLPKLDAGLLRPGSTVEEPITLKKTSDDNLFAPFIPHEEGPHKVNVRKDGKPVPDSPYSVDVPPKVEEQPVEEAYPMNRPCDVGMDIPSVNLPNDLKKLTATLQRPGSNKEEPVNLELNPDNTLGVTFVPKGPGEHLIRIKKDGKEIPESPVSVMIEPVEPENAVGSPCDVPLDIPGLNLPEDLPKITATLKRPGSNVEEPVEPKVTSDGNLSVSFVPKSPGEHLITVKKRNRPVPGSPFSVMITAPEPTSEIGKPTNVPLENVSAKDLPKLDAGLLRPGSTKEEPVPIKKTSDDNLYVPFIPHEGGPHKINVRKDGRPVPDSPYIVDVPSKDVEGEPKPVEEVHPVGKACDVGLDIPSVNLPDDFKKLTATLQRPKSTKEEPFNLELNPDNTLGISFVPMEPGEHLVHVKKSGEDVPGSPFAVMVEAAEAVNAVGRPCDCHLDIPGLNLPGDLSKIKSTLKRPDSDTEEPIKLKVLSDNTLSASFVPRSPGEHLISVKKFSRHLSGSPFSVMVSAPETASQSVGRPCGLGLEIPGLKLPEDFDLLTALLKRPGSTAEEPLKLVLNSDNTLSVSFIPKETGEHHISVFKNKRHVTGSPFSVMVSGPGPADPSKVKAYGPGLESGVVDEKSEFTVNTRDAGYGGLGLSIEGPSKAEINCIDNEDGTCTVDYVPSEPGDYTIHVRFADEEIPGSPFTCNVVPKGGKRPVRPVVEEGITSDTVRNVESAPAQRTSQLMDDLVSFSPQQPHDFSLDLAGYDLKNLKATVETPSGKTEPAEIVESTKDTYTIRFVTKEGGIYKIFVKNRGRDIPGSPFKVKVDAPKWGGAGKCSAAGPGLERGVVNQPAHFTVWTRDAGPGGLALAIEGPAKTEINCKDNGDGSCSITYVPTEPGEYTVHVRFADEDIPGAPFKVFVTAEEDERFRDLSVSDMIEGGIAVGQPTSFSVQTNGPVGEVTASVLSPSGSERPATVSDRGNGSYAIRFVPKEVGDHLISVRFDGLHIPGSPFKVKVGGGESYPGKVKAYGPGLDGGVAGQETYFTVDALRAGTGALSLSVDGPAKVRMNCTENPDGTYRVTYHPLIAGEYKITIKFADQNIPKSPYNVTITGDGSSGFAEKCKPVGSGLHRAVIGEPNAFTVNCSDAGRGSLMVGVEGPAIPAKEIKIKHTGGKVYAVNYTLEEPGEYVLKVLWGEKHIPGSPFHVTV